MRYTHLLTIAAATLATSLPAHAQSTSLTLPIPFDFAIGSTSLARGQYQLSRMADRSDAFLMRGPVNAMIVMGHLESTDADAPAALVFHRYGDRYFLRTIRPLGAFAVELPESPQERAAAEAPRGQASQPTEAVTVLAQR